jgi:hypothetical protein
VNFATADAADCYLLHTMQFAKGTMMELLTAPKAEHMVAKLFREPSMQKTVRYVSIAAQASTE